MVIRTMTQQNPFNKGTRTKKLSYPITSFLEDIFREWVKNFILEIKVLLISLMVLKFLLLSKPEYMPGLIYSTWYSNMRRSAKSLDFHEVWSGVIFWQYPGISDFAALRILRNFPRLENLWIHREIPFFRMTEITLLSGICKKTDISWSWNVQLKIHKKGFQ